MKHIKSFKEAFLHQQATVYDELKKYPDKWVHFTNINKIGINPSNSSVHEDPRAIYTYPISWLLENEELNEEQFGFKHTYYYILDIKPNLKCLNLSTLTKQEALSIAKENGWGKEYVEESANFEKSYYDKRNTSTVGGVFYNIAYTLVGKELFTWNQLLKGFESFYDEDGCINPNEPCQYNVFSIKNIKVLDFGKNSMRNTSQDILVGVLTKLFPEQKIKILYDKYNIYANVLYEDVKFKISVSKEITWYYKDDTYLNYMYIDPLHIQASRFSVTREDNENTIERVSRELLNTLDKYKGKARDLLNSINLRK